MPIGELSRRVGVSSDLLRKWEQRYGVLRPGRTIGNRRLYSRVDEARIRLMLRHVQSGVPPAQAAELVAGARFRVAAPTVSTDVRPPAADAAKAQLLAALERFDESTAEQLLEKLLATAATPVVLRDVVLPLLRELGDRWADTDVSIAQEHFASTFVHGRLLGLARGWDRGLGPRALLACPAGEQHTFGLITFGIALHQVGWRITYLGADTPLGTVAEAARALDPRLIVISVALAAHLRGAEEELRSLAERWTCALAGAGVTDPLAGRCGVQRLAGDPVTAAEEMVA